MSPARTSSGASSLLNGNVSFSINRNIGPLNSRRLFGYSLLNRSNCCSPITGFAGSELGSATGIGGVRAEASRSSLVFLVFLALGAVEDDSFFEKMAVSIVAVVLLSLGRNPWAIDFER